MKQPQVLGYVMSRNEWPFLGLAISHALACAVQHVVVLNHDSDDETEEGLASMQRAWPRKISVLRALQASFLQAAATAVVATTVDLEAFDWVYVFDADEFLLAGQGSTLQDTLRVVPTSVNVVRYELDQWVVPSHFDGRNAEQFSGIQQRAITNSFVDRPGETRSDLIERGDANFFDVPFPSKVIVRSRYAPFIAAGAHGLHTRRQKELRMEKAALRAAHIPFRSRRQLNVKAQQGRDILAAGFPAGHAWQAQMLARLEDAGRLDRFWSNHSIDSAEKEHENPAARPTTVFDGAVGKALGAASVALAEALSIGGVRAGTESSMQPAADCTVSVAVAMDAVHGQMVERDAALKERHAAFMERDAALSVRDAALVERDAALVERDWWFGQFHRLRERRSVRVALRVATAVGPILRSPREKSVG